MLKEPKLHFSFRPSPLIIGTVDSLFVCSFVFDRDLQLVLMSQNNSYLAMIQDLILNMYLVSVLYIYYIYATQIGGRTNTS
jgi:hypothetical protein